MYRRLSVALIAALVALLASPAFAYHGSHGGGASFDAFLPIVVVVALVMGGLLFWGRKKPKAKRRKHRGG